MLHTYAVEAIMEGNTIRGVITESKSGRRAVLADRVIDCTGDADVAHLAGAEYRKTARPDMMGVTTVLNCSGVERERFLEYTERNPATYRHHRDHINNRHSTEYTVGGVNFWIFNFLQLNLDW
jgi:hypothetical protein